MEVREDISHTMPSCLLVSVMLLVIDLASTSLSSMYITSAKFIIYQRSVKQHPLCLLLSISHSLFLAIIVLITCRNALQVYALIMAAG